MKNLNAADYMDLLTRSSFDYAMDVLYKEYESPSLCNYIGEDTYEELTQLLHSEDAYDIRELGAYTKDFVRAWCDDNVVRVRLNDDGFVSYISLRDGTIIDSETETVRQVTDVGQHMAALDVTEDSVYATLMALANNGEIEAVIETRGK